MRAALHGTRDVRAVPSAKDPRKNRTPSLTDKPPPGYHQVLRKVP